MFQKLEIFQMAHSMASHAGRMQVVAAQNIANADTPGYKSKTLTPFKETLNASAQNAPQRATRSAHLNGITHSSAAHSLGRISEDETAVSEPNGNSVAIEDEILRAVDAKRQHDRALAIYRSSLNILRTSIARS